MLTPDEAERIAKKRRKDNSVWTPVCGLLACLLRSL